METLYSFVTLWSSKRLCGNTETSPEVLEPTRLIPSPVKQGLPLPSLSAEEAGAALAAGSTGSSGDGSGLAPPLLQQLPPATSTPAVEVADTATAAAYVTVAAATLETGPTETGGRPPSDQQRPLLSTPSITAEVGEGDTAAAAALMPLKLGRH